MRRVVQFSIETASIFHLARALALCTKHETTEGILDALLAEPRCPAGYAEKFRAAMGIFRRNE